MEERLSFYNLAKLCQEKFEKQINAQGKDFKYLDTLFAAIDDKDCILVSETPEILLKEDVYQFIMIHRHIRNEVSRWYSWYTVEFVDHNKSVHTEKFDERFSINVNYHEHFYNQWIHLKVGGKRIFQCRWPNESCLQAIWNLYQRCKSVKTDREAELLGELAMMDESVLSLQQDLANANYSVQLLTKERDQYKSLLDEIKDLIHDK